MRERVLPRAAATVLLAVLAPWLVGVSAGVLVDAKIGAIGLRPSTPVVGQQVQVSAIFRMPASASGEITFSDGTHSCVATLPSTSCGFLTTSAGAFELTATYSGDSQFDSALSHAKPYVIVDGALPEIASRPSTAAAPMAPSVAPLAANNMLLARDGSLAVGEGLVHDLRYGSVVKLETDFEAVSEDGSVAIVQADGARSLYFIATDEHQSISATQAAIDSVALSDNGRFAAYREGSSDRSEIWLLEIDDDQITARQSLMSGSLLDRVEAVSAAGDVVVLSNSPLDQSVSSLQILDTQTLATSTVDIASTCAPTAEINAAVLSPSGQEIVLIATCDMAAGTDRLISYSIDTGQATVLYETASLGVLRTPVFVADREVLVAQSRQRQSSLLKVDIDNLTTTNVELDTAYQGALSLWITDAASNAEIMTLRASLPGGGFIGIPFDDDIVFAQGQWADGTNPAVGGQANGDAYAGVLSDDGAQYAFTSLATNLTDTPPASPVYLRDTTTGIVTNIDLGLAPGSEVRSRLVLSNDGATLVAVVREASGATRLRLSRNGTVSTIPLQANAGENPQQLAWAIDPTDATLIYEETIESEDFAGLTRRPTAIYLWRFDIQQSELISLDTNGAVLNLASRYTGHSADGRYVGFRAGRVAVLDYTDWVRDLATDTTFHAEDRPDVALTGKKVIIDNTYEVVSRDGRYFMDDAAPSIVDLDTGTELDIAVPANWLYPEPAFGPTFDLSADGQWVAFRFQRGGPQPGFDTANIQNLAIVPNPHLITPPELALLMSTIALPANTFEALIPDVFQIITPGANNAEIVEFDVIGAPPPTVPADGSLLIETNGASGTFVVAGLRARNSTGRWSERLADITVTVSPATTDIGVSASPNFTAPLFPGDEVIVPITIENRGAMRASPIPVVASATNSLEEVIFGIEVVCTATQDADCNNSPASIHSAPPWAIAPGGTIAATVSVRAAGGGCEQATSMMTIVAGLDPAAPIDDTQPENNQVTLTVPIDGILKSSFDDGENTRRCF